MFHRILATALLLGGSAFLHAATVTIGQVVLQTDGVSGNYQLTINNMTGGGNCDATFEVCDAVNFVNWQLSVAYNNGTTFLTGSDSAALNGNLSISPFLGTGFTVGVPTAPWTMPLCEDLPGLDCPNSSPLWTITGVEFSGEVDTTPLLNFFSGPTTFVPSTFSASFTPDAPDSNSPLFYYSAGDIVLSDTPAGPGGGGGVPEPGTALLVSAGIGSFVWRMRRRRAA